ncbi:MAG: IPT/TIG domain-containing protein, partial [Candidatus Paceibacterota bacterium]
MRRHRTSLFFLLLLAAGVFAAGQTLAQGSDTLGLGAAGQGLNLGGQSLMTTIVRIINIFLGLLGIIAVGIVLYGGFVYMTAGGDEEKVSTAKNFLKNGVIGLAVILSAYAIASFVINQLMQATGTPTAGTEIPQNCLDPNYARDNYARCAGGSFNCSQNATCCTAEQFVVKSITPSRGPAPGTPTGMNNGIIRVVFSRPLASAIAPNAVFDIRRGGTDVNAEFTFAFVGAERTVVAATPSGPAGLLTAGDYQVDLRSDLRDDRGAPLGQACGFPEHQASFTVDTTGVRDTAAPVVSPISIAGSRAPDVRLVRGATYPLTATVTDNSGIGYAQLTIAAGAGSERTTVYDGPAIARGSRATTADPYLYAYTLLVPATVQPLTRYTVTLTVYDIDNNRRVRTSSFVAVGDHCSNRVKDGDETDVDFGGSCVGNGSCTEDWQCYSGNCDTASGICIASPVIADVAPWDGAGGNWITVTGRYFGEADGVASFGYDRNNNNQFEDTEWIPAAPASCGAEDVWHDQYAVIQVPISDQTLPTGSRSAIRIARADDQTLFDTTVDDIGPVTGPNAGLFVKNNTTRPGMCAATPSAGVPNAAITLRGIGFGASDAGSRIAFGGIQAPIDAWTDTEIRARVPRNMLPGLVTIAAQAGAEGSNAVPFTVLPVGQETRPAVDAVDPGATTRLSYVTISGRNFGAGVGQVFLAPNAQTVCPGGVGCVLVPPVQNAICSATWSDTQIVIQIPNTLPFATYAGFVKNAAGDSSTGGVQLSVQSGAPNPSICLLSPASGPSPLPAGETVQISGENFTNTGRVRFWTVGSVAGDLNTWLSAGAAGDATPVTRSSSGGINTIRTAFPVSPEGYSLQTGPIRIQVGNRSSNSVRYTVSDCRQSPNTPPQPNYQCCKQSGVWRDSSFICPGETREAGYVWRFTTGNIPRLPFVVEQCENQSSPTAAFPSPTPWRQWSRGQSVCLNASVAVRFSLPMDDTTLTANNLRLLTCGTGDEADCRTAVNVSSQLNPRYAGGVLTLRAAPAADLAPNTWYRAVILDGATSLETVTVLGVSRTVSEPLLATRACGQVDGRASAYCYDFKTGPAGTQCVLSDVGMQPPLYTVQALGPLLDPRFPLGNRIPFYYLVWGRGNQECTVLNVDGMGWAWGTGNATQATASIKPGTGYTDTRGGATAVAPTGPQGVEIRATAAREGRTFVARSQLTIDIGDAEVVESWPNCVESCVNAALGVRFNRPMYDNASYSGALRLYRCASETCYPGNTVPQNEVPLNIGPKTDMVLEAVPRTPLAPNTWYQMKVQGARSIGGYNGTVKVLGKVMKPFTAKFRTKADGALCTVSSVAVQPAPFTAFAVGEKTTYAAVPLGAPDQCSPTGQRLAPWDFGWNWNTDDALVATVTNFQNYGAPKPYCSLLCLASGSDISADTIPGVPTEGLCGNARKDPGEDCDIGALGEVPGVSCGYSCLRPGASTASCGDGKTEPARGEECDTRIATNTAFCASNCLWKGSSRELAAGSPVDTPLCGSNTGVTPGEDCEAGTQNETDATCSASCLHTGTRIAQSWCDRRTAGNTAADAACTGAVSMCGNNVVESDEECEIIGGNLFVQVPTSDGKSGRQQVADAEPGDHCTDRCMLQNICATAVPASLRCEAGTPGCNADCTLAGSSIGYAASSLCGDGVVGAGEFGWFEYTS